MDLRSKYRRKFQRPNTEQLAQAVQKAQEILEPAISAAVTRLGPQLQGLRKLSERVPVIGAQLSSALEAIASVETERVRGEELDRGSPFVQEAVEVQQAVERAEPADAPEEQEPVDESHEAPAPAEQEPVDESHEAPAPAEQEPVDESHEPPAPAEQEPLEESLAEQAPAAEQARQDQAPRAEDVSAAQEDVSEELEAGPKTVNFALKPIRTRTMARLLAAQGQRDRALAIYAELMAEAPDDQVLREEADAVRRGHPQKQVPSNMPQAHFEGGVSTPPDDENAIRWEPVGSAAEGGDADAEGAKAKVTWQVSEEGVQRARAVLGDTGELAVRIITIGPDADRVLRSDVAERGPVESSGSWSDPELKSALRSFAAVGLRAGDRFVSIAHAAREG